MQEEVEQRVVTLIVNCTKYWLTAIINYKPISDKRAAYCSQLTHRRKPSQGIR